MGDNFYDHPYIKEIVNVCDKHPGEWLDLSAKVRTCDGFIEVGKTQITKPDMKVIDDFWKVGGV